MSFGMFLSRFDRVTSPRMSDGVTTDSPHEIGGYTIIEPLHKGETFLAEAHGGRRIVLKILPADCLLEDELHPAIHDRLSHVRELAERNVANLHGVERDRAGLIWSGITSTALPSTRCRSPRCRTAIGCGSHASWC